MNAVYIRICLIVIFLQLNACSMAELTVKASMPMIEGGIQALNHETDLLLAESAIPSNIELMEGMIINAPDNIELRNHAAQAYYGYAYGFIEDNNKTRAANFYKRGLKHALYNLHKAGITQQLLNGDLQALQNKINTLDEDNISSLFWAASNWAKWIDHNRDKPEAIADLPRTVLLMQRVIELDEEFFMAGPHLFFAVYYGSRSPMLGGNYKLSEQHFNRAREINNNQLLLVDLLQAEYLDRQTFNQKSFHQRLINLREADTSQSAELGLINQIAKSKASNLLNKEALWF